MDALEYVDVLFREYLLFRGFRDTLSAFDKERLSDKSNGFQVEKIVEMCFNHCHNYEAKELLELWQFLDSRFFSRLDGRFTDSINKLETSLMRYYLVHAVQTGKIEKVTEFFKLCGERLISKADDWSNWFSLPYVKQPAASSLFRVYFSREWAETLSVSLRNFLLEVFQNVRLPTVLRFNMERLHRKTLELELEALRSECLRLQGLLAIRGQEGTSLSSFDSDRVPSGSLSMAFDDVSGAEKGEVETRASPSEETGEHTADVEQRGILHADAPGLSDSTLQSEQGIGQGVRRGHGAGEAPDQDLTPTDDLPHGIGPEEESAGDSAHVTMQDWFSGHSGAITRCRFSSDGLNVGSSSLDGTVRIWATDRGMFSKRNATIYCGVKVLSLTWDAKANRLLLLGTEKGGLKAWNVESKRVMCDVSVDGEHPRILDLACSPLDNYFVSTAVSPEKTSLVASRSKCTVWSMRTFKQLHTLPLGNDPGVVRSLCFNHNGKIVAAAEDGWVRLFDVNTRANILHWQASEDALVTAVKFSADQNSVYTLADDGMLCEWSLHDSARCLSCYDVSQYCASPSDTMTRHEFALFSPPAGKKEHVLCTSNTCNAPLMILGNEQGQHVKAIGGESSYGSITSVDWHPSNPVCTTGTSSGAICLSELGLSK
mmetsp:Transcript_2994/g.10799  ORF Transcript_2994/g.10799 Transcript_2994/m.10799 type:complete len:656 (+) Transcript_2994:219-2186(+)